MSQSILVPPTTTPDTLCHSLKALAERTGVHLVARPYNPFEAGRTTWWLVPSSDYPAHRFGKYSVRWADQDDATILAGLEVERGVGPSAVSFPDRLTVEGRLLRV